MLKKKISMVLATLMVATTVTGMNVQYAAAAESGISQSSFKLSDGEYTVKNITHYIDQSNATGEGMARQVVLEDSNITVKNGVVKMTVKFNGEMYGFLENINASLNGQVLNAQSNAEDMSLTFEIPSLDSKVLMNMNVTVMGRDVSFYLQNDANSLSVVSEAPVLVGNDVTVKKGDNLDLSKLVQASDKEDGNLVPVIEGDTSFVSEGKAVKAGTYSLTYKATDSTGFSTSKSIKVIVEDVQEKEDVTVPDDSVKDDVVADDSAKDDNSSANGGTSSDDTTNVSKVYSIQNSVTHENETGRTMARKYLNSTSKVEEVNGEKFVTLTFTGVEYMKNHEIYVDGNKVNHEVVSDNGSELSLRFKVPSLDSNIKAKIFVIPMGRDIEFGINLLKDTLAGGDNALTPEADKEDVPDNTAGNGGNSPSGSSNVEAAVPEENNVTEKVTIKEYTVKNNVIHDNETGRAMARKYLNSTSQVKEVNGKYYVTLTFTGKEFMSNYSISVNGNKVNHTVVSDSADSVSLRFEVSSLKDNIKVSTYVTPMSRNVEFGVELLLDTLTLVKEYTVEPDEVANDLGLPETGDATSKALAGFGLLAAGAGIVLTKKRK